MNKHSTPPRSARPGHSLTTAYGVACDVNAGFDFDITARANVPGPNAYNAAE